MRFSGELNNVKVASDGTVYFIENNRRIRRLRSAFPGFAEGDIHVPSISGGELYRFDASGRHLETRDALTGALRTSFGYDGDGRLTSMTDANGNALEIERASSGAPLAVLAPGGQRTSFTVDGAGRATAITNPAGRLGERRPAALVHEPSRISKRLLIRDAGHAHSGSRRRGRLAHARSHG